MFDTLPALQGIAVVEGFVTVFAWLGLFTFLYGLRSLYKKFS